MSSDVIITWQLENQITGASMSLEKKKDRECNTEHSENQGHLAVMGPQLQDSYLDSRNSDEHQSLTVQGCCSKFKLEARQDL